MNKPIQKTVKVFESDLVLINEQAKTLGCSAAEVINTMCEELRRKAYLEDLGEAFDLAMANEEQVGHLQSEQDAWDIALSDGLDDA